MKTTLQFNDALIRLAKRRAADEGTTLTRIIEQALRRYLGPQKPRRRFRLNLLIKRGRPVHGVDLADRDDLYERMEGRR